MLQANVGFKIPRGETSDGEVKRAVVVHGRRREMRVSKDARKSKNVKRVRMQRELLKLPEKAEGTWGELPGFY